MTYLVTGAVCLAAGLVIGNALAEPTIHHLSAKARLYLELYRASETRRLQDRMRMAEAEARDHRERCEEIPWERIGVR